MKIKLIGEDFPDGLDVDWPAVPGTGDFVSVRYRGGTSKWRVHAVEYLADADHKLVSVEVELES